MANFLKYSMEICWSIFPPTFIMFQRTNLKIVNKIDKSFRNRIVFLFWHVIGFFSETTFGYMWFKITVYCDYI